MKDATGVPRRFAGATFATFEKRSPSQRAAWEKALEWVEATLSGQGPMLALTGPKGVGKSHLLWAARAEVYRVLEERKAAEDGRPHPEWPWPRARLWFDLAPMLERGAEGRADAWRMVKEAGCLMLDEVVPVQFGTREGIDPALRSMAMGAYANQAAMFVTTNRNLAEVMGEAGASRFVELLVEGPNGREG